MQELFTAESIVAFLTLAALEIVLGVDNIVFIAILTGRLDPSVQGKAQKLGLLGAMLTRVLLLLAISWIMRLVSPLFAVMGHAVSGKDLILLGGGLFLIGKATYEIHHKLEGKHEEKQGAKATSFGAAIFQIMMLDVVFSLDSVITAVGMVRSKPGLEWVALTIMISAVVAAIVVMLVFAGSISRFIERHPTLKMLALSFLLLVGVMLVAEGLHQHINKGYIYFAMAFSLFVELLNLKIIKKHVAPSPAPQEGSGTPS